MMVNCFNKKSPPPPPPVRVIKNDGKSIMPQPPSDKSGVTMSHLRENQPPLPRPPAPPMPPVQTTKQPEPTYPMTNAELAEAIEYARATIDKVTDTALRKRMQEQVVTLLDLQVKRAMAVKV